ncbi:MAG: TIGR00268 family protein, partial [Phycisphaerae bacterium]|nr:TIGR00268 family protein [Phycisphaerae bacterium]
MVNPKDKYNSLQAILKKLGKVVVAYSGGVDSTFLLKAAVETLGAEN